MIMAIGMDINCDLCYYVRPPTCLLCVEIDMLPSTNGLLVRQGHWQLQIIYFGIRYLIRQHCHYLAVS